MGAKLWISQLKNLLGEKIITECIIDSQTIKIHNKGEEVGLGFTWVPCNGHKKINGRKRHIVTDCDGYILKVKVHKANIHDTKGGVKVMGDAFWKYPSNQDNCCR